MNMNTSAKETLLFSGILITLWKRKFFIIGFSLFCVVVASLVAISLPNKYASYATLAPVEQEAGGGLSGLASQFGGLASIAGINLGGNQSQKFTLAKELLQSKNFIINFVEKHDLKLEIMAQSKKGKKVMNMVYGLGAAIVILGALFKIQHITILGISGGFMLTLGLVVEALVFAISAFEPVDDDLDWTKVYPELGDADGEASGANGMLSQKLDNLLKEAEVDGALIASLGDSIKNFQGAAKGLSSASESIATTNSYNEQMALAASQMESLNGLYQVQMENANKQAELNSSLAENSEKLKSQMETMAENMSSLNGVYGGMLSAMSSK